MATTKNGPWTITPDLAAKWLQNAAPNRSIKRLHVERFKAIMRSGNWSLNGETIKFNLHGQLIDGQHRLLAAVEAHAAFASYVLFGLPVDAQQTVDIGMKRSAGDMLHFLGEVNTNNLAATLRWVWRYDAHKMTPYSSLDAPPIEALYELLQNHPSIRHALAYGPLIQRLVTRSLGSAFFHLMSRLDEATAASFFEVLASGENLSKHMPLYLLRTRLIANSQNKARLSNIQVAALIIKAWNATREGKSLRFLRWQDGQGEEFPRLG